METLQKKVKILANTKIAGNYYRLILRSPEIAHMAWAGQFVMFKVAEDKEPLLRRPFSIYKTNKQDIEFLYEVLGKGTQVLAQRKPGDYIDIIGPLGNGFSYKSEAQKSATSQVLVAGGMGIAPLIFLAEKLADLKTQNSKVKKIALIGARAKRQILCEKEFKELGFDVKIATDDGSLGFKGKVTDLLSKLLSTIDDRPATIYACGPKPMLKAISLISRVFKIPAQISLEAHMACGIGACLGCVVKTKQGYQRVCKEGPVFNAQDIIWKKKGEE